MEKQKILLIEDDPNLGFILQENLELKSYDVTLCRDGEAGLKAYKSDTWDLCLLDVMLPKKDGFTLAREIRLEDEALPIIFLTAKSLKTDRIEGLKIGGDDYITKPFSIEELNLRIQAVLKRSNKSIPPAAKPQHHIGRFHFDADAQTLQFQQEEPTRLTSKEADLLKLLCQHKNTILTRDVALTAIWEDDNVFNARSMDVYISRLRKYLRMDPDIEIRNVHGKGFRLIEK